MSYITTEKFYGTDLCNSEAVGDNSQQDSASQCLTVRELRKMPDHIMGPTQFWKEFWKQAEALATAAQHSSENDPLCTFVSQRTNGARVFIVAHPEVYWWYYEKQPAERRCSYEVIPEGSPCRLYLDLEYLVQLNPDSNGLEMTNTLVDILCAYIVSLWGLPCNRYNIVNLDSSTQEKFSRHLIFTIAGAAFKDNFHAGRFIKTICDDIINFISEKKEHKILSAFDEKNIEELLVQTKTGKKLFIDTGVYTRNRHFRIFKSTKWGKNSHLIMSQDCKYIPMVNHIDHEQTIFIESLITYFPNKKDLILLEFLQNREVKTKTYDRSMTQSTQCKSLVCESQYQALDDYIRKVIHPGRIRAVKYFSDSKTLVYETVGYRYCENIGRCHKSNNVFWIVDLHRKVMYQKCHDVDCIGFKSESRFLPDEIRFHLDEDNDNLLAWAMEAEEIAEEIAEDTDFFA